MHTGMKMRSYCQLDEASLCRRYFLCNHKEEANIFLPYNCYKLSMKEFNSIKKPIIYIYISHIIALERIVLLLVNF